MKKFNGNLGAAIKSLARVIELRNDHKSIALVDGETVIFVMSASAISHWPLCRVHDEISTGRLVEYTGRSLSEVR